jgi:hypothetical protein
VAKRASPAPQANSHLGVAGLMCKDDMETLACN